MFRIGEFSKLAKATTKTLRFYDEAGILKPSFVDSGNGYRYYEAKQLYDLNRIMALRQAGLSIADIKQVITDTGQSAADEIYRANKAAIESEIDQLKEKLSRLGFLLEDMQNKQPETYQVTLKNLPRQTVFFRRQVISAYKDLPEFIADAVNELRQKRLRISSPPYSYIVYLDRGYRESNINVEYAQAIELPHFPDAAVKISSPALFACVCHKGPYETIPLAYGHILDWIAKNGYSVSGGIRECYIKGVFDTKDADEWITEIEIPVKKPENYA